MFMIHTPLFGKKFKKIPLNTEIALHVANQQTLVAKFIKIDNGQSMELQYIGSPKGTLMSLFYRN